MLQSSHRDDDAAAETKTERDAKLAELAAWSQQEANRQVLVSISYDSTHTYLDMINKLLETNVSDIQQLISEYVISLPVQVLIPTFLIISTSSDHVLSSKIAEFTRSCTTI